MSAEKGGRTTTKASSIHIYRTTRPESEFERIGRISLDDAEHAYTIDEVYKAFRSVAAQNGATAIIDFDVSTKLDVEVTFSDKNVTSTEYRYNPQSGRSEAVQSRKTNKDMDTGVTVTVGYVGTLVVERGAPAELEPDRASAEENEAEGAEPEAPSEEGE
ncbi:MAG: hypothetical protein B7733_25675 [Myxococcales bacterium FL481]|nr:MAG: hypothetical protein B7733_25675 [Myxococcales bacterium FL481]